MKLFCPVNNTYVDVKFNQMLVCLMLWILCSICAASTNNEKELRDDLFKNYSTFVRPVDHPDKAVFVMFNIQLLHILSVDERGQTMTAKFLVHLYWQNDLLKWDPRKWGNITKLYVTPKDIWIPRLVLANGAKENAVNIEKLTDGITILPYGIQSQVSMVVYTSSINVDVSYFPFDRQICELRFNSWGLNQNELRIFAKKGATIDRFYINSSEWEIIRTSREIQTLYYEGYPLQSILFTFTILRKSLYYLVNIILPCIILMLVVAFSYFLPPSSGERMGVLITVLLAFAVFLEVISSILPPNSDSISMLSIFFLLTMVEGTFSFFSACFVMTLLNKGNKTESSPPPPWARRYILRNVSQKEDDIKLETCFALQQKGKGDTCKRNANPKFKCHRRNSRRKYTSLNTPVMKDILTYQHISIKKQDEHTRIISKIMKKLDEHLQEKSAKIKRQDDEDNNEIEWNRLAQMLDWISFWVFMLMFVSSLFILYAGYKQYN